MREKFGAEVRGFQYAFVMESHGEGWESNTLIPVPVPSAAAPAPAADDTAALRRRAGDRKPTFIEIKSRP